MDLKTGSELSHITAKRLLLLILAAALLSFALSGCSLLRYYFSPEDDAKDKIKVNIQLDLEEDIGLLVINHNVNGKTGAGGISNADKSMLKRNSKDLWWDFEKERHEVAGDTADIIISFIVVTKYFEPNYENEYPEEFQVPVNEIRFTAAFGETVTVKLTGGKENGYSATVVDR